MDTIAQEYFDTMAGIAELKATLRYQELRAKALRTLLRLESGEHQRQNGVKNDRQRAKRAMMAM